MTGRIGALIHVRRTIPPRDVRPLRGNVELAYPSSARQFRMIGLIVTLAL